MAAFQVPAAPQIESYLASSVFVHHSQPEGLNETHGNGARLKVLGGPLLEAAYVDAVNIKYPTFQGNELEVCRPCGTEKWCTYP